MSALCCIKTIAPNFFSHIKSKTFISPAEVNDYKMPGILTAARNERKKNHNDNPVGDTAKQITALINYSYFNYVLYSKNYT